MGDAIKVNAKEREGGILGLGCKARHPDHEDVWCRRLAHDDGPHRAFVFGISEPEEW